MSSGGNCGLCLQWQLWRPLSTQWGTQRDLLHARPLWICMPLVGLQEDKWELREAGPSFMQLISASCNYIQMHSQPANNPAPKDPIPITSSKAKTWPPSPESRFLCAALSLTSQLANSWGGHIRLNVIALDFWLRFLAKNSHSVPQCFVLHPSLSHTAADFSVQSERRDWWRDCYHWVNRHPRSFQIK